MTHKCHTFSESGSKTQMIGEEKNLVFLNGKKFFFQIPYWKGAPSGAGGGVFFGSYQKNSFCKVAYFGEF